MGSPRQKSSLVRDPLGLLALPMTSTGSDRPTAKSSGMAIAVKTIGGALVAVLIMVSLVSPHSPAKHAQAIAHCDLGIE